MITIEMIKASEEISRNTRSEYKAEAAERIALVFGYTLEQLGITPYDTEAGVDWGMRIERHSGGKAVAMFTLAQCLADKLKPGWDEGLGCCPYSGAGKSAEWATSTALYAINEAINFPQLYVSEKRGPDKPAPKRPGEKGNWSILGSGDILGYQLYRYDEDNNREVIQEFKTEDAAYEALVQLANEEPQS